MLPSPPGEGPGVRAPPKRRKMSANVRFCRRNIFFNNPLSLERGAGSGESRNARGKTPTL